MRLSLLNIISELSPLHTCYRTQFKSKVFRDNDEVCEYVLDNSDIFNRYSVDYFLSGTGLAIHPDYKKHGIATEMLKARKNILRYLGLEVTSTGFSSIGAQKAAKRSGFEEDYAIRFNYLNVRKIIISFFNRFIVF